MGNCIRCCRRIFFKRFRRPRTGRSDEISNLVDDEEDGLVISELPGAPSPAAVTEREKLLLRSRNYEALMSEQRALDAQIDEQLRRHEEELRRQEEAARTAAAAASVAAHSRRGQAAVHGPAVYGSSTGHQQQQLLPAGGGSSSGGRVPDGASDHWLGEDGEWNVAGGDDDFDMFLDEISIKSATVGGKPIQAPAAVAGPQLSESVTSKMQDGGHDMEDDSPLEVVFVSAQP